MGLQRRSVLADRWCELSAGHFGITLSVYSAGADLADCLWRPTGTEA